MKQFVLLIFLFGNLVLIPLHGIGQPNTLYFMKGIPQTKDLNPARPGITEGWYLSMPFLSKIDLSLNTNNWAYSDLIHWGSPKTLLSPGVVVDRSDSLVIDLNKLSTKLKNNNFVYESAAWTYLEAGFKSGKNFYAASVTDREFIELRFGKGLVNLIQNGNYPYQGTTFYSGSLSGIGQHYRELMFNYARDVNKKLTVGGAAKILFGLVNVQSNGISLSASSPQTGEYLDVSATGKLNISAPLHFNYDSKGQISSVNTLPNYSPSSYIINFSNPGLAFDLGFAYKINKKTEFSASLIDLGFINWGTNVSRLRENGHFLYKGIEVANPSKNPPVIVAFNPVINQLTDSITKAFKPDTLGRSFATLIPTKIYVGIDRKVNDNLSVSAVSRIRIINNAVHTSLTASVNALVGERLSLSASYSAMESTFDNLGVGLGFILGNFQIYTATDNLFSPFYPSKARNMNVRFGINLLFRDKEKSEIPSGLNPNCHCPY